jgi:hypothetical protein
VAPQCAVDAVIVLQQSWAVWHVRMPVVPCVLLRGEVGLSEAQAAEELTAMAKAGRYVRDIWS